jgi:hypothetical protein
VRCPYQGFAPHTYGRASSHPWPAMKEGYSVVDRHDKLDPLPLPTRSICIARMQIRLSSALRKRRCQSLSPLRRALSADGKCIPPGPASSCWVCCHLPSSIRGSYTVEHFIPYMYYWGCTSVYRKVLCCTVVWKGSSLRSLGKRARGHLQWQEYRL